VPRQHYKLKQPSGNYALGCCDRNSRTIYLNKDLNLNKLHKVLCHEIAHAAMFSYNVLLDTAQEELVADLLATYGNEIINITN